MKALVIDHPGSVEDWHIANLPIPEPKRGEVRLCVEAVGLNPADYKIAQWGHPAWQYPFVMGLDVAGIVDALGPDVENWQVGDRGYYHGDFSQPGGFAEYAVTTSHTLASMPGSLTFAEAASVPCAGFAAYQAVFRKARVQPGQTVLIQGGAGGVGGYAIQLCKHAKAVVITTASGRNENYVKSLGADYHIDYQSEDVTKRIQDLTDHRGVEVVIDAVSQATTTAALEYIAFGGQIVGVDSLPDLTQIRPFAKAISLHEIALGVAHLSGDRVAQEDLAHIGMEMGQLLDSGAIRSTLSETIALDDVPQALRKIAGRHVRGKIVADISAS